MTIGRKLTIPGLLLYGGLMLAPASAIAEDIDIFNGPPGTSGAPTVMIMMDNSDNWVSDSPQGKDKFLALAAVLNSITSPINVGLAMYSPNNPPTGVNIRFAPRDMSVAANRTAFNNLGGVISASANVNKETGMQKDEAAAFYEIYKYYSGLAPRSGLKSQAKWVDAAANHDNSYPNATAFDWGMTSGFAFKADGTYNPPASTTCNRNYIVYIVANNHVGSDPGLQTYQGTTAPAIPALPSPAINTWADDWARFMFRNTTPQIVTYVIDTYNLSSGLQVNYQLLLKSIAKQGGGTYTAATTQAEIQAQLLQIFDQILSVNSAFASASLPINASNRTLSDNQVYIGMFRPDPSSQPRWFGNLKKYQLVKTAGAYELGDSLGTPAVNPLTGFIANCSLSYWTTDSGTYWSTAAYFPSPAGSCPSTTNSPFSDAPDGPFVEKGGAAEILRKGNTAATSPPVWPSSVGTQYRKLYTLVGSALAPLTTTNTGLNATTLDWVSGRDVDNENNLTPAPAAGAQLVRFSVHGDIVHSHPYVVDQTNLPRGITAYYGANDGALRALDTSTGRERWAFYAPEGITQANMNRLRNNTPAVSYFGNAIPGQTAKTYFFDGALSAYQSAGATPALNNDTVWLYAAQRRGGRMLYALDVSTPDSPAFKWRVGCTNPLLTDTASCSSGTTGIGQTWSAPTAAFIQGAGNFTQPVVIVGGGYDMCEDANTSSPSCATPKGNAVYVLDGATGAILKTFATDRSVAADIALVDVNNDGYVDYAYVADTGGSIYRIDFVSNAYTAASSVAASWTIRKVAFTSGAGRKFLHAPAVFASIKKSGNYARVFVAIGSGDREKPLKTQYPYTTPVTNRFYLYVDDLTVSPTTALDLDSASSIQDFTSTTSCSTTGIFPQTSKLGWRMDLNQNVDSSGATAREQVVGSPVIAGGMVTFSTNAPDTPPANSCSANLGKAFGYWVNLLNASGAVGATGTCGGARSDDFVGGGLPPAPTLARVTIDGKVVVVVIGAADKKGGASAPIQAQEIKVPVSKTRRPVYWYQSGDN